MHSWPSTVLAPISTSPSWQRIFVPWPIQTQRPKRDPRRAADLELHAAAEEQHARRAPAPARRGEEAPPQEAQREQRVLRREHPVAGEERSSASGPARLRRTRPAAAPALQAGAGPLEGFAAHGAAIIGSRWRRDQIAESAARLARRAAARRRQARARARHHARRERRPRRAGSSCARSTRAPARRGSSASPARPASARAR